VRAPVVAGVLLLVLPLLAHSQAVLEDRLLGPGDGAVLHYPLRAAVWEAYRGGELPSWNPALFSGTPLLASYRPGALYPPMVALSWLPPFLAFQILVLASLAAAGVLVQVLLRRLGANTVGAYAGGLFFALGPYLVGHLDDTATVVAAPLLPLALVAAESHFARRDRRGFLGLAFAVALLLVAGSPEAARAGLALVAGRLLVGHLFTPKSLAPHPRGSLLAGGAALLLAAPQLLPTLLAAREAGGGTSGVAPTGMPALPGLTGLVLRYVSHTPAPALALSALPLLLTQTPVRVLGTALLLCLGLQWGRGPLAAPGALALVFDLTLSVLAGLSLSAQWAQRRRPEGRRLRAYLLVAALASVAALSVSATMLGPLPETLAGAVGVLALAYILFFALVSSVDTLIAGVFLLPLTASFLLQPHGRGLFATAPHRSELARGTATSAIVDRSVAGRRERLLTLVRSWPRAEGADLAFPNEGALRGRWTANGYDPMSPRRAREVYDRMSAWGALRGAFLRSDPARLEAAGVRWVQVPSASLVGRPGPDGLGEALDLRVDAGVPRFLPTAVVAASELRLSSSLSDAVGVAQGMPVARIVVRLAVGRDVELTLRAGIDTAEWAYDRPDVRPLVAHERPRIIETFPGPGGGFEGHRYLGILPLPGRYYVDGIRIERLPGPGILTVFRAALADATSGRAASIALAAAFVSDASRFREAASTPTVRLFDLPQGPGIARVVERLRVVDDDASVVDALRHPTALGIDLRSEALVARPDVPRGFSLPESSHASRGSIVAASTARLDVRAEGPGLLVVAETWDRGWSALVDDIRAPVLRVEHARIGVRLPGGFHRVELRHRPPGLVAGLVLAAAGALLLAFFRI
jgi:hypothetical protein